jgi:hypothetical protein
MLALISQIIRNVIMMIAELKFLKVFRPKTLPLLLTGLVLAAPHLQAFDPGESLEFRGRFELRGVAKFNIYNKETQSSKWIKIGQRTGEFTLKDYDESNGKLIFERGGEEGILGLSQSKSTGPKLGVSGGGNKIESTNLRFKNGLYYELGKEDTPFTGQVTKEYPTGKSWYERGYKEGKKHGKTIEWFPNGQKKYEMFYDDNKRTGIWTYWDQNGKVTAKREYENNQFKRNLPLDGANKQ